MNLTNKTIVATSAARGIGRALALELALAGSHLALIDMNAELVSETARLCEKSGSRAQGYIANVTDETMVEETRAKIVDEFGRLDGVIITRELFATVCWLNCVMEKLLVE